jgi:hypothetical protein
MPLMKSRSPKAFEHNVKAEMRAGKPQPQALAISYSVKRKAPKKKASGGTVESGSRDMNMADGGMVNAKNQKRPMPDQTHDDSAMVSRNSSRKSNGEDGWTQSPTVKQAQDNNGRKVMPIKKPKMVPSNAFSTRLRDEEDDLQASAKPAPYGEQPPEHDNEMDAAMRGQGPKVEDEHSTHRKPYAKGGMASAKYNDPMEDDQPSMDEGASMAMSRNEMDADMEGSSPDMEDEHSTGRKPYAGGGKIGDALDNIHDELDMNPAHDKHTADDSEMQPEDEEEMEHHDSIAAAIMAKRDRLHAMVDSGAMDEDHAANAMAEGGRILSKGSWDTHESADQADLSRNADEDANEEDQMSFGALRKENYSESEGLAQLDNPKDSAQHGDTEEEDSENRHDMVSRIMSKMNRQRQFKAR